MSDVILNDVITLALQLSPAEQAQLLARLAQEVRDTLMQTEPEKDSTWSDAEIAEMLTIEPLTGAEIIAAGLTGGWADMGITDSAEWVNEQKRKRRERHRW